MIDVEVGRLREPAAWAMLVTAAVSVLVLVAHVLFGDTGGFGVRAGTALDDLSHPIRPALALGAVLLATRFGPVSPRARLLLFGALGTLGLAALFSLLGLGALVFAGALSAGTKVQLLLLGLPQLALLAIALLYGLHLLKTLPQAAAPAAPFGPGGPAGAPFPGPAAPGGFVPQAGHPQAGPFPPPPPQAGPPPAGPGAPAGPEDAPRPALEAGPSAAPVPGDQGEQAAPAGQVPGDAPGAEPPAPGQAPEQQPAAAAAEAPPVYGGDPGTTQQPAPRQGRHGRTDDEHASTRDVPRPPAPTYVPPAADDYNIPTTVVRPAGQGVRPPAPGPYGTGEAERPGGDAAQNQTGGYRGYTSGEYGPIDAPSDPRYGTARPAEQPPAAAPASPYGPQEEPRDPTPLASGAPDSGYGTPFPPQQEPGRPAAAAPAAEPAAQPTAPHPLQPYGDLGDPRQQQIFQAYQQAQSYRQGGGAQAQTGTYATGPQQRPRIDDPLDTSRPLPEYTSYPSGPQPSPLEQPSGPHPVADRPSGPQPQPQPAEPVSGPHPLPTGPISGPHPVSGYTSYPSGPQPSPLDNPPQRPSLSDPRPPDHQRAGAPAQGFGGSLGGVSQASPYQPTPTGPVPPPEPLLGHGDRLGSQQTVTFQAGGYPESTQHQGEHRGEQQGATPPNDPRNRDEPIDPTAIYTPDRPPPR